VNHIAILILFAIPAAAPFKTQTMYQLSVESLRAQPLDEGGKPLGKGADVPFSQNAKISCALDRDPKRRSLTPWIKAFVDNAGKLHRLGAEPTDQRMPERGGAPDDVATCALSALRNSAIQLEPGPYRLSIRVRFRKYQHEIQ